MQETKIPAGTLERELAIVEGWDSFFSCSQSARGYSGVATFCRTALALPFASEEGFTGCRAAQGDGDAAGSVLHPSLAEGYTVEELQASGHSRQGTVGVHASAIMLSHSPSCYASHSRCYCELGTTFLGAGHVLKGG